MKPAGQQGHVYGSLTTDWRWYRDNALDRQVCLTDIKPDPCVLLHCPSPRQHAACLGKPLRHYL